MFIPALAKKPAAPGPLRSLPGDTDVSFMPNVGRSNSGGLGCGYCFLSMLSRLSLGKC